MFTGTKSVFFYRNAINYLLHKIFMWTPIQDFLSPEEVKVRK